MLIKYFLRFNRFSCNFDIYYSIKLSLLFLKGTFGLLIFYLPSLYYYKKIGLNFSLKFKSKFFFISCFKHIISYYGQTQYVFSVKLRIKGLGYKVRKLTDYLFYLFFNYTNLFYIFIPKNVLMKNYRKRFILISPYWSQLKNIVAQLLLLKKLGWYNLRGIRCIKHIILLKKSSKKI